jgi:hypothetical protein
LCFLKSRENMLKFDALMEESSNINKIKWGGERWSLSKDDDNSLQEDYQHVSPGEIKPRSTSHKIY